MGGGAGVKGLSENGKLKESLCVEWYNHKPCLSSLRVEPIKCQCSTLLPLGYVSPKKNVST